MSIAWSTLLSKIIMSIRSFHVSQDGTGGGGGGEGGEISIWMNTRISYILTCVKVVLTPARGSRPSLL